MKSSFILAATVCGMVAAALTAQASLFGPTPYLQFADSPFRSIGFSYFYLEDFEDGAFNVPGVTYAASGAVISYAGLTDSVDADDGAINNSSHNGGYYARSFWAVGTPGFTFFFNASVLGSLPTHAGVVWTDGAGTIYFEAFDQTGASLGTRVGTHADGSYYGTTGEDRFYGAENAGGISRIHIWNTLGGIEVDHLQYGRVRVPEAASSVATLGVALAGLLALRRRF